MGRKYYVNSPEARQAQLEHSRNHISRLEADERIKRRGEKWDRRAPPPSTELNRTLFRNAMRLADGH
jgi:hypothetical protein